MTPIKSRKQRGGEFKEKIKFCILQLQTQLRLKRRRHQMFALVLKLYFKLSFQPDTAGGPITTWQLSGVFYTEVIMS